MTFKRLDEVLPFLGMDFEVIVEQGNKEINKQAEEIMANTNTYKGIYAMHKYWGKKPFNEISKFIEKYTMPGEVVLDSFCGSGVTLIEALKANRKCIGVDLNPLAIKLAKVSMTAVDIDEVNRQFKVITKKQKATTDPNTVDTKRVPPETHAEIVEFARKRNPFNHPCVMYKKSAVEAVGSYQDFYLLEDYYLWLRMLMAGYQGYNIQEPLLHMRAGSDMYKRRAGWKYVKTQKRLFKFMKDSRFIGNCQFIKGCVIRSGSALAPNWLRKFMFEKVLRK